MHFMDEDLWVAVFDPTDNIGDRNDIYHLSSMMFVYALPFGVHALT